MAIFNSARRILLQPKTNHYRQFFTGTTTTSTRSTRILNPAQNNSFGSLVRPKSPAAAPTRFFGMNNPMRSMSTTSMGALAINNGGSVGALAIFPYLYKGIQEIIADYVHHEMTRNLIMLYFRLFLIVAAKDVFVSLVF